MKVTDPVKLQEMRERMKKARESKAVSGVNPILNGKKSCPTAVEFSKQEFTFPDGRYYCIATESGFFKLVTLHIKRGAIVSGDATQIDIFGVIMGKMIQDIRKVMG